MHSFKSALDVSKVDYSLVMITNPAGPFNLEQIKAT